ncbi:uncharacterized protein LOC117180355 [Belonocnema kinseyi]|uniref:uncharacterized protein LOC117180355 n=1 Tax=Belonocnema kinseyi TaxID=2817044 RepID=UPI00143DBB47|nr:uncharacterized protein LOC117180355 [Belonocnema kinseyi]
MKKIIGTTLCTLKLAVFFIYIELTLQTKLFPLEPYLHPDIHYYRNGSGGLQPINGVFSVVVSNGYIIGVFDNGAIYPAIDRNLKMVKVRVGSNHNIPISLKEYQELVLYLNERNLYLHLAKRVDPIHSSQGNVIENSKMYSNTSF